MSDEDSTDYLEAALQYMDQGLIVVRPDLSVAALNVRATELADCPANFAQLRPNFRKILEYQVKTGAISQSYMDSRINEFALQGDTLRETHTYTRKTQSGRWLDVRTTPLPDGGFVRTFTDQTERHAIAEAKRQTDDAYRALFENAAIGIYRCSLDGHLLRANPELVAMHGHHTEEDLLRFGETLAEEIHVDFTRFRDFLDLLARDGRVTDFEVEIYRHLTRERIWISKSAWAIFDAEGEVAGYEGTVVEITERKRIEALVQHAADHDAMTGLPNRAKFQKCLDEAMAKDATFHLAYLDLDKFKSINDTYGHCVGDAVLAAVAQRFAGAVPAQDPVFRMGGDEFAIILYLSDPVEARRALERVIRTLDDPIQLHDLTVTIGVSVGAMKSRGDTAASQILHSADMSMYRAKAISGSALMFHDT